MKVLVVGGTGPSGPHVVNGLLARGDDVTIFHSGRHEASFDAEVEHLHGDAHFAESIEATLGNRRYDCVIGMYGRLRLIAAWAQHHAERLVGVSGTAGYAIRTDARWGALGRTLLPTEAGPWLLSPDGAEFQYKIHRAEEAVLSAHREGSFHACVVRPPNMYGPRQIGPEDWSFIRRVLDGRRRIILPDNGLKIDARIHVRNFAAAVLFLSTDPAGSRGRRFNVRDEELYTMRQRVELIARLLEAEVEFEPMPFVLARPMHPAWRWSPVHRAVDDSAIRELGHHDVVSAADGIADSVAWLTTHQPERGGEEETQLGDAFDYETEDQLLAAWDVAVSNVAAIPVEVSTPAHRYRHPERVGEEWMRPAMTSYDPGV